MSPIHPELTPAMQLAGKARFEDVRHEMPNYEDYDNWRRSARITGVAIHHSGTIHDIFGRSRDNAHTLFDLHVNRRQWAHGGYHYVVLPNGTIQYALDESVAAYHAGFRDPDDHLGLEGGQYWNNHFLAICLPGWFSSWRRERIWRPVVNRRVPIFNLHTRPARAQMQSLLILVRHLIGKYTIHPDQIRGHRELEGSKTQCPGYNFDLHQLRSQLASAPPTVAT